MYFLFSVNVISVEKREAVNSSQEELAGVQDRLNLARQVSLTEDVSLQRPAGLQVAAGNNKSKTPVLLT